jgi:hypothetical protein
VNVHFAENTFATPPSTLEPATTTPSPQREHHRGHLPLSSLLGFISVWHRRRWGAPSGVFAWMRAFEPQHCRPMIVWRSQAIHAPVPAVAMRGPSEITGLRAELVVAGNVVRRRATSSRALGYQEAAPGEQGEAARAVGTAVASACPRVLRAWPSAGRAVRETAATRLGIGVIFDPGSPSSCVLLCRKLGASRAIFCR